MIRYVSFAALLILIGAAIYGLLTLDMVHGPIILAVSFASIGVASLVGFNLKLLIPDITIGFLDAGLLSVVAVIAASGFGIVGVVIAVVIGDSLIDMMISIVDEPLKRWYREHHVDEIDSRFGHSYDKMIGCFIGTGLVLTVAGLAGVSPWELLRHG